MTPPEEKFIEAAKRGDLDYIKVNFATVQQSEPFLYNPTLAEAFVFSPSIEICSYFLDCGFDINETYRQDYKSDMYEFSWTAITALWQATYTNNMPKTKFLIAHGADVNIPVTDIYGEYHDDPSEPLTKQYRSSALMEAVNNQQISGVRMLLQAGADVNYRDSHGVSALDIGRRKGNADILALLSAFASSSLIEFDSTNHPDVFWETPLLKAIKKGQVNEVKNLIAQGADVNLINQFKESVLMVAANENQAEIVKLLIQAGADVNYKDNFGKSVLQIAEQKGLTEIAKLLKSAGCKGIVITPQEEQFLQAAKDGHKEYVQANLHNMGLEIKTAAFVLSLSIEISQILLENGVDLNARATETKGENEVSDWTALGYACAYNDLQKVKWLVAKGADIHKTSHLIRPDRFTNWEGDCTPQEIAQSLTVAEIVRIDNSRSFSKEELWFDAVKFGFTEEVKNFIEQGININSTDDDRQTALVMAVKCGKDRVLDLLLAAHADVSIKDKDDFSALLYAASAGNPHNVQNLLQAGANPNDALPNSQTALMLAARSGNSDTVHLLVEAGADVMKCADNGYSALLYAVIGGSITAVQELLQHGAAEMKTPHGTTALMLAVREENPAMVKFLLEMGADVNARDDNGQTALKIAHVHNQPEIVALLKSASVDFPADTPTQTTTAPSNKNSHALQDALIRESWLGNVGNVRAALSKGADPNAAGSFGEIPLAKAILGNQPEVVKVLLDAGADPQASYRGTALMELAQKNEYTQIVELLSTSTHATVCQPVASEEDKQENILLAVLRGDISEAKELLAAGADANAATPGNMSVLMLAVWLGQKDLIAPLLAKGAQINAQDENGYSALMFASHKGYTEIANMLLTAGADVNVHDASGSTALMFACERENTELVKSLIDAKPDINAQDKEGKTALRVASINGHTEIVRLLLDAGANVNIQDKYGRTSLMSASMNGHLAIVQILLAAGADVHGQDEEGNTALKDAILNNNTEIVSLLKSAGAKK